MTVRKRSLPAVGGDPLRSRMAPRDPNHPAWKTSLCRYWKEGSCFKRDSECAFRHGSEELPAAFRKAPYAENAGNVSGADGTATQLVVWKESVTRSVLRVIPKTFQPTLVLMWRRSPDTHGPQSDRGHFHQHLPRMTQHFSRSSTSLITREQQQSQSPPHSKLQQHCRIFHRSPWKSRR